MCSSCDDAKKINAGGKPLSNQRKLQVLADEAMGTQHRSAEKKDGANLEEYPLGKGEYVGKSGYSDPHVASLFEEFGIELTPPEVADKEGINPETHRDPNDALDESLEIPQDDTQEIPVPPVPSVPEPREGDQPLPKQNDSTPIQHLVIKDVLDRMDLGKRRYGTYLQAGNGRKTLQDAYEEALDLAIYLRLMIEDQDG
jgi:hypothetical protein